MPFAEDASTPARRIGRYAILRVLGVGSSGTVYEALQDEPRRRVALKVVGTTGVGRDADRLRYEAGVLGRLQHPAIAQIHEAGQDPVVGGYIAMELAEGARHIDEYVRVEKLPVDQIVALFAEVCDAVAHGHEKGVVHRDIKPSNVLVDAHGRPKVIDFGIARVLGAQREHETAAGRLVGTLAYMSPEQVGSDAARLDVRSDVYALGAVLYELVAGRTVLDLRDASLEEALLRIREERPAPLRRERPEVEAELEWIVFKALDKDPERRYSSAARLAADLRGYLAHEYISAAPPTTTYRLRVLVRRHRIAVTVSAALVAMLVIGSAAAWMNRVRSLELARRADVAALSAAARGDELAREVAIQREILDAQATWFTGPGSEPLGQNARFVDVLANVAQNLDANPPTEPTVEVALRFALCRSYELIDVWEPTYQQAQRTRAAMERGGSLTARQLDQFHQIEAHAALDAGFAAEAFALAVAQVEIARANSGPCSEEYGNALQSLASTEYTLRDYASGAAHFREAIDVLSLRGAEPVRQARMDFVHLLVRQRRFDEALSEAHTLVAEAAADPDAPRHSVLTIDLALASALVASNRVRPGLDILLRTRAEWEELFGPDAYSLCAIDRSISDAYFALREAGLSLDWARRSFEGFARAYGLDHPNAQLMRSRIAMQTIATGSIDEGSDLFEGLIAEYVESEGPRSKSMLELQLMYGRALQDRGARFDRALELYEFVVDLGREIHGEQPLEQCIGRHQLAILSLQMRRPARAVELLTENLDVVDVEKGRLDLDALSALRALGQAAEMMNLPEEALCWNLDLNSRRLEREGVANPAGWGDAHRLVEALLKVGDVHEAVRVGALAIAAQDASETDPIAWGRLLLACARASALADQPEDADAAFCAALRNAWSRLPESSAGVPITESSYASFLASRSEFDCALSLADLVLARQGARPAQQRECALVAAAAHAAAGRTAQADAMRRFAEGLR